MKVLHPLVNVTLLLRKCTKRKRHSRLAVNMALCFDRFVGVSEALLEIAKIDPELTMVAQRTLKTGYQSMKAVRTTLVTVESKTTNKL